MKLLVSGEKRATGSTSDSQNEIAEEFVPSPRGSGSPCPSHHLWHGNQLWLCISVQRWKAFFITRTRQHILFSFLG